MHSLAIPRACNDSLKPDSSSIQLPISPTSSVGQPPLIHYPKTLQDGEVSPALTRTESSDEDSSNDIKSPIVSPVTTTSTTPRDGSPSPKSYFDHLPLQTSHFDDVRAEIVKLRSLREIGKVVLDGYTLDIPSLIAITSGIAKLELADGLDQRINASVKSLQSRLDNGEMVYGVNTGFGGSADVRTDDLKNLQMALVQHQNVGILTSADVGSFSGAPSDADCQSLPTNWARGTMLVRINTIIRGHSAVSIPVIRNLCHLVVNDVVPVIPSRGTISASGDLMPLSYVAGLLQGNPAIFARVGNCLNGTDRTSKIMRADEALKAVGLEPIVLGPKEGLGLLNGTAVSGSVGGLVISSVNQLAVLTQATTALNVEALAGSAQSFHPFIGAVRPHPGQLEAARNITSFLQKSMLASGLVDGSHKDGLAQDRYALRTASQFLGPVLEDLRLATSQIKIELNSTTDNPLIDGETGEVYHGGNFQGIAVSLAMEKSRLACALMGKLLFAQTTELMNPAMSRGLPPNLAPDDPSMSFLGKGIDIAVAAYCSELNYLAHPVVTNVQSAEMHNQSVNSLALISARYTSQAVDVLTMMLANSIWAGLQGVDLRIVQMRFSSQINEKVELMVESLSRKAVGGDSCVGIKQMKDLFIHRLTTFWASSAVLDLKPRSEEAALAVTTVLFGALTRSARTSDDTTATSDNRIDISLSDVSAFRSKLATEIERTYLSVLREHEAGHLALASEYLGVASRRIYSFVRQELGLGFHRGRADDPILGMGLPVGSEEKSKLRTVGGQVSVIYEAIKSGALVEKLVGLEFEY